MNQDVQLQVVASPSLKSAGPIGVLHIEPLGQVSQSESMTGTMNLPIRLGKDQLTNVSLPIGRYLASVRIPAGKVFKEVFDVTAESDTPLVLLGAKSVRKLPTAQLLPKPFAPAERTELLSIRRVPQLSSFNLSTNDLKSPISRNSTASKDASVEQRMLLTHFTARVEPLRAEEALKAINQPPTASGTLLPRGWLRTDLISILGMPSPTDSSVPIATSRHKLILQEKYFQRVSSQTEAVLHYASLIGDNSLPAKLIVARLPGWWQCIRSPQIAVVEVHVSKKSSRTLQQSLAVSVSDPDIQSLLGFIRQGDLAGALTVLDQCIDLLAHKSENPYAAAAAGYVLLNAPPGRIELPWENWIGNLGRWFRDLPDGTVQHATLLLQSSPTGLAEKLPSYFPEQPRARAHLAAKLLLESLYKGIPLYRAGLRLLASNLRIVLNDSEQFPELIGQLKRAYELVSWLLMRVDPGEVFTVIDLSDL